MERRRDETYYYFLIKYNCKSCKIDSVGKFKGATYQTQIHMVLFFHGKQACSILDVHNSQPEIRRKGDGKEETVRTCFSG